MVMAWLYDNRVIQEDPLQRLFHISGQTNLMPAAHLRKTMELSPRAKKKEPFKLKAEYKTILSFARLTIVFKVRTQLLRQGHSIERTSIIYLHGEKNASKT